MDKFLWKENFNIGIEDIDSQHQILLELFNGCIEKASLSEEDSFTYMLFIELKNYADTHFKAEEQLMKSIDYPDLDVQVKQHRLFVGQLAQLEKALQSGDKHVIATMSAFLRDWCLQHILEHDKRIGVYLLAQNQGSTGSAQSF